MTDDEIIEMAREAGAWQAASLTDQPNMQLGGIEQLRRFAALSAPDDAEPVAWAVVLDGLVKQPTLSKVAAERLAEAWRRDADDVEVRPLYAHPPRSGWRPASELPEDERDVLVWKVSGDYDATGIAIGYYDNRWCTEGYDETVTHWRDIEPPEQEGGR